MKEPRLLDHIFVWICSGRFPIAAHKTACDFVTCMLENQVNFYNVNVDNMMDGDGKGRAHSKIHTNYHIRKPANLA